MTPPKAEGIEDQGPRTHAAIVPSDPGRGWAKYATVGAVCLFSALMAFWGLPIRSMKPHECLVSVTAREMVASGNYIVPTLNGQPRLQKPPLSYWLVAGISRLRGRCDELSARLPSAAAGFLSAIAILYFVSRWTSLRTGLLCVSLWVTSVGFLDWSHNARSEMLMTLFCTLCLLLFFEMQRYRSRSRQWVLAGLFWLSFGLANLAKGPIPFPVVLLPIFAYTLLRRKKRMIGRLHLLAGLLITLAIALPWPILIAAHLNWDLTLWKNEVLSRFGGEYATRGRPFYYYVPITFKYAIPWVVLLPIGLLSPLYRVWGRRRPLMIYLGLWFFVGVLFFSISHGKRPHYILPQMPAAAILMGIALDELAFGRRVFSELYTRRVLTAHAVALAVAAIGCAVYVVIEHRLWPNSIVATGIGIAIFVALAGYFVRASSQPRRLAVPLFVVGFGTICLFALSLYDRSYDEFGATKELAQKIRTLVPKDQELYVYGMFSDMFLQYYGQPLPTIDDPEGVRPHYLKGDWVFVVMADLPEDCQRGDCQIVLERKPKKPEKGDSIYGYLLHAGPLDGSS